MTCPNKNLESWKVLVDEFGEGKALAAFTLNNNEIPEPSLVYRLLNIEKVNESDLDKKIESFLEKIGISVKRLDVIRDSAGQPLTVTAKADLLNKVIEVVNGRADISTLSEEAAHFFVELLGEGNSLYQQMYKDITSYSIYKEVVDQYKDFKQYRNANGTINFDKLKKEAIGKLIAFHVIRLEKGEETPQKIEKALSWWHRLWSYISSIFQKADDNPFITSANRILNQETDELLSADTLEEGEFYQVNEAVTTLLKDQERITLDNTVDPRTGQKRHIYYVDGKPTKGSVTTTKVDRYYKKIFTSDRRSDAAKEIDLLKAEYGDLIHEEIQGIFNTMVDPKSGVVRSTKLEPTIKTTDTIYRTLEDYMSRLISSYPAGTLFFNEMKIYDAKEDIAGSIDLVAIKPDGTTDVYDWKSQEIGANQDEIKTYKEPAYRIQLSEYKRILGKYYGIKKFGKVRAIPIKTQFRYDRTNGTVKLNSLTGIGIGDVDPENIPVDKNYLLPVVLADETTGDLKMDNLIKKLNAIYRVIEQKRAGASDRFIKKDELSKYRIAIRDLQVRKDARKFIQLGVSEVNKYQKRLNEGTLTYKDALESLKILEVFANTTGYLSEYFKEIKKEIIESGDSEYLQQYQDIVEQYNSMNSNAAVVLQEMETKISQLASELAEENGIENILGEEKEVGTLSALFSSISTLPTKATKTFYKLLRNAQNARDVKYRENNSKLAELKTGLQKWGSGKGLSGDRIFDGILEIDEKGNWNGNFLKKYRPEFYQKRDQAIKTNDVQWVIDNTDFNEQEFEKQKEKVLEYYKTVQYSLDPAENSKRQIDGYNNWLLLHTPVTADGKPNSFAYLNPKNQFLTPKETWQTDKWKELKKPENKPLKDTYDYFQSLLRHSERIGMLDEFSPGFIPSVFRTKIDQVSFGDVNNVFSGNGFFESLQVDGTPYFPETDPITGKVINRIPVYFTQDIGVQKEDGTIDYSKKSRDLFKVFSVWGAHTYHYETMSEIEDASNLLVHVEKNKDHIVTDMFGTVKREGEDIATDKGNERNAGILEKFVEYYLYNRRYGSERDKKIKVNGKEYSLTRTFGALINFFTLKTLALNPISGTSQFVGGTGNALLMGSKKLFFTNKDWAKSIYLLGKKDSKAIALLDYFDPFLENQSTKRSNNLSVSTAVRNLDVDKLYFIQRGSDKAVQFPVAISMMLTHMVQDGKIVNILDHVKEKYNYNTTFYNLPQSERKELSKKINEEVEELKQTKSIYNTATIEGDNLTIPGLNINDTIAGEFRSKIKKVNKNIIGNSTTDDINLIRTTVLGTALMNFRTWMPQMFQERFGGISFDEDLEKYQMGKTRLFFSELFSKRGLPVLKSFVKGLGSDGAVQAAKERYQIIKAESYETGIDFNVTEGEFIDMYIGNLRSQLREFLVILGVAALLLMISQWEPEEEKGIKRYAARALNKYYQEFAFYYNPVEFTNLVKSPLPVVGLAEDLTKFTSNFFQESYGRVAGDEEITDKAQPAKYLFKMFPIAKEAINMTAIFDDDFRKNWDIRL